MTVESVSFGSTGPAVCPSFGRTIIASSAACGVVEPARAIASMTVMSPVS